jgi:uncharacterized protein YbjT (DUF2867 family)
MHFAVVGITGNTGAAVAHELLAAGHRVRAIVRSPEKAASWKERGVEIVAADVRDGAALGRALQGVDGAYVLSPPDWTASDLVASRAPVIQGLLEGLAAARVPRTVALSSVGVHLPNGTGPIQLLRPYEAKLGELPGVTFVRAAYFHENLASAAHAARKDGVFPVFFDPQRSFELVATRDIGARSAELLQTNPDSAPRVVNLAGPERLTLSQVAELTGRLLGKSVQVLPLPPAAIIPALRELGAGQIAELYAELNESMDQGRLDFETPPSVERGTTPVETTLRSLLGLDAG